jgi:RimJ/RimL family protein N-acetyltransferase
MEIPRLTTDRLVLRGLRASDWDDYAAMNADPLVRQWLRGTLLSRQQAWEQMETFLGQWALRRDRLVSYIRPENIRSRRVAEKLGAVRDGQFALRGFVADVWLHASPGHGVIV